MHSNSRYGHGRNRPQDNGASVIFGHGLALCLVLSALLSATPAWAAISTFGYADVVAKAQELAETRFKAPERIPESLIKLGYDRYKDIRFRPEKTLWRRPGTNFDVQFVHPGLYYTHPVKINIYDAEGVHKLAFSKELFSYGNNTFEDKIPADLGFAGLVLSYPLKTKHQHNQVIVFAGASYFRAVARDNVYGLSARGLAIDTALPSGEEFPFFREFWLVRPSPRAEVMKVYAVLDSRRVAGAYRFIIRPGVTTVVDVKATLFLRETVEELGIAPLTSMFLYGEQFPRPAGYWRPEVHDSDGLLMENGTGERLWRPLVNPKTLGVSYFALEHPKGFGLMQRDRDFLHFEDLETRHELRPSAWVLPRGDWGKGFVKLTEIPSDKEVNDNIVAYWIPADKPKPGEPFELAYELEWRASAPIRGIAGRVTATRIGDGTQEGAKRVIVDFEGQDLTELSSDEPIEGKISVGKAGKLLEQQVVKNPVTGGWRLAFQVLPPKDKPLELRAFLTLGEAALSETWSYRLTP